MRIDVIDNRRGVLRVRVDNEDDLWLLSLLISPGDLVKALTTRDVSLGYEKHRVPMVLTVRVEKVEFQPFTNRLRVHGIVVDGPDRFGVKGSHHTINIDIGKEVTIFKERWSPALLDQLLKLVRPIKFLLIAIDFDEYAVGLLQSQGLKLLDEKTISLPISSEELEHARSRVIRELARRVVDIVLRNPVDAIIIGSPSNLRNELANEIRSLMPNVKVYTDTVANGGYAGLRELMRRDIVQTVLRDISVAEAEKILDEFNYLLIKNPNKVAYGLNIVSKLAEMGAIAKLLVLDTMLSTYDSTRELVEQTLINTSEKGGKVVIVPEESPPGQHLKMLGGIIAILRYEIDTETIEKFIGEKGNSPNT